MSEERGPRQLNPIEFFGGKQGTNQMLGVTKDMRVQSKPLEGPAEEILPTVAASSATVVPPVDEVVPPNPEEESVQLAPPGGDPAEGLPWEKDQQPSTEPTKTGPAPD